MPRDARSAGVLRLLRGPAVALALAVGCSRDSATPPPPPPAVRETPPAEVTAFKPHGEPVADPCVTVRDPDSEAVANCMVTVRELDGDAQVDWGKTASDGTVRFAALDPSREYALVVEPPPGRKDLIREPLRRRPWKPSATDVRFPPNWRACVLKVRVLGPDGRAAPRVDCALRRGSITSRPGLRTEIHPVDADGCVEFRELELGERVQIAASSGLDVRSGSRDAESMRNRLTEVKWQGVTIESKETTVTVTAQE